MHKILTIVVMSGLLFSMSQVFGQDITFGEKPKQITEITIDVNGIAHVVHKVEGSTKTQQIETYNGTMSNLSVTNENGGDVQYFTLEKQPIAVVLPPDKDMTFIRYDLTDVLSLRNGVWTWDYTGQEITNFYFPGNVDIIWVNENPVYLAGKGIRQHGGAMKLEYIADEPMILKETTWENEKFTVGIRTLTSIDMFEFDQSSKSLSFDISDGGSYTTAIIPLKLLWEPYDVYLNSNGTENSEFYNNGTHVWIGFKPETSGNVQIIGTTVIPEFPLFVPLVIGISAVILIQFRNRFHFH
ncbi:MAG TPA: hypothetical protein VLB45_07450 [Nitrosopumilaceae archaeon]|nr:hypothetical protein [Nitrosopumilaceae archaeon]